jgi:hypothetical protein
MLLRACGIMVECYARFFDAAILLACCLARKEKGQKPYEGQDLY